MGGDTQPPGAWGRVPVWLRVGGLGSGCLLLIVGAVYVLGFVAVRLASLTIALFAAVLIAALLEPMVTGLHRLRVPRAIGALLGVLVLIGAFVAPAVLLWNLTANQFGDLGGRLTEGLGRARTVVTDLLPLSDQQFDQVVNEIRSRFAQSGSSILAGALTLVEILAGVIAALFVAFFILKDGPSMWAWFLGQLPERSRALVRESGNAGWEVVGRYIRGTLIVAAIDAVGIGIALAIIGVPLALPLALLVFVGSFVPYVGSTISGSVAVLVALAANGPIDALLTLAAVVAVQQIEGNFLEPFIVGHQVRLHPVVVVVAVFAGSLTAGIAGAVVAVPLTAVVYRIWRVMRKRLAPAVSPQRPPAPESP
jgi:predicted PurR-regulated permease PerM